MSEAMYKMMEMGAKGYCCSQIIMALALEARGEENPHLIRAMSGLCQGMGDCQAVCGVLSGAACALALFVGKGEDAETEDFRLPLMLSELNQWFHETVGAQYGGVNCCDILGDRECGNPDMGRCSDILAQTHEKLRAILTENDLLGAAS